MRSLLIGLACTPVVLAAQAPAGSRPESRPGPVRAVIRAAEGGAPLTMAVQPSGRLFAALGVAPGSDGRRVGEVRLARAGGTATTPAELAVSDRPGAVTFRAPAGGAELELVVAGTPLRARGRAVRLVRDREGGPLRAEAVPSAP